MFIAQSHRPPVFPNPPTGFWNLIRFASLSDTKCQDIKVSPVTVDKLPMAPPSGGARFGVPAWTVQPAGSRFDPPIEVTMPNATAQPVGDNIPIVQWDHDLGMFVPMGRATVSEDGSVLITDAGSGITKAGWGGVCLYDPTKCAKKEPPTCKDCQKLGTGDCPNCEKDSGKNKSACSIGDGSTCGVCKDGSCDQSSLEIFKTNTPTCCGGDKPKEGFCCIKGSSDFGVRQVERGRPFIDVAPDLKPVEFQDNVQFAGPPKSDALKDRQLIAGPLKDVTYSVDGCSVPVNAFAPDSTEPGIANLRKGFPPGLFFNKTIGEVSTNLLADMFYEGCKRHDYCYQTCGSKQAVCDTALRDDIERNLPSQIGNNPLANCNNIDPARAGSGFYDDLYSVVVSVGTAIPTQIRLSLRQECFEAAKNVYLGLVGGGKAAHTTRQQEMCIVCKK